MARNLLDILSILLPYVPALGKLAELISNLKAIGAGTMNGKTRFFVTDKHGKFRFDITVTKVK